METARAPVEILFEDADLLVVAKPCGIVVDDELVAIVQALSPAYAKAFPFHRLDKETSGIVLFGKTRRFAKEITQAFEEKRIRKAYLAVVRGEWPASLNRVEEPIEGRASLTTFRRVSVAEFDGKAASLLECLPKTGRTHQIRIHCAGRDHAILGDVKYGAGAGVESARGQALHAYRLDFRHPADGREVTIRCAPEAWRSTWLKDFSVDEALKKFSEKES